MQITTHVHNIDGIYELFIVRLYDGFDYEWIDCTGPLKREDAEIVYAEKTENGTKNICYDDIDYYKIYPADTRMLRSAM